jgi:hypothetical protein
MQRRKKVAVTRTTTFQALQCSTQRHHNTGKSHDGHFQMRKTGAASSRPKSNKANSHGQKPPKPGSQNKPFFSFNCYSGGKLIDTVPKCGRQLLAPCFWSSLSDSVACGAGEKRSTTEKEPEEGEIGTQGKQGGEGLSGVGRSLVALRTCWEIHLCLWPSPER